MKKPRSITNLQQMFNKCRIDNLDVKYLPEYNLENSKKYNRQEIQRNLHNNIYRNSLIKNSRRLIATSRFLLTHQSVMHLMASKI